MAWALPSTLCAQAGRIYTKPDPAATGAISGHVSVELSHAVAIAHDRLRVFLADLSEGGHSFRFPNLPASKYDLVLVAKTGTVYEGLALGNPPQALPENSLKNMEARVSKADSFFNKYEIHRTGLSEDGDMLLAFVERYRAEKILRGNGKALGQMIRRLEIIEFTRATDEWQLTTTRHLYREGEPQVSPHFLKSVNLPALSNVRVVDAPKDLGEIPLSN